MGGGGSSSSAPSTETVQNTTTPPAYQVGEQQALNQQATALSAQPYPNYQGQLIAGLTPQQQTGMQQASDASTVQNPYLQSGSNLVNQGAGVTAAGQNLVNQGANMTAMAPNYLNAGAGLVGQGANLTNQAAGNQWNAQTAQQYMSPYAQAALAPQIQQLQIQQGQNANNINAQATMAGAFGGQQYGNEQALNNLYANQSLNQLEQTGMNTAYNTGLGQFNTANQNLLTAGNQLNAAGGQMGSLGGTMGNVGAETGTLGTNLGTLGTELGAAGGQMGTLGQTASQTGIAGATANFNAGTQQQALNQQQLTEAYQNFLNQAQWPEQMLNLQNSMLQAGNQYTVPTQNLAPTSATAQNVGLFSSLAGGIGSLLGSGGSGGSTTSDIRLKKNIKRIGEIKIGIPLYEFDYIWARPDAIKNIGVMAQDVLKVLPEAVAIDKAGFMSVNYDMVH